MSLPPIQPALAGPAPRRAVPAQQSQREHSSVGLILAALSLPIMRVPSYPQRHAGRELGPRSAVADSKQTLLCTYLSAVLLVGLDAGQ